MNRKRIATFEVNSLQFSSVFLVYFLPLLTQTHYIPHFCFNLLCRDVQNLHVCPVYLEQPNFTANASTLKLYLKVVNGFWSISRGDPLVSMKFQCLFTYIFG